MSAYVCSDCFEGMHEHPDKACPGNWLDSSCGCEESRSEDLYLILWRRIHKARKVENYYQTVCGAANKYLKQFSYIKPLAKNKESITTSRDLCMKCFGKDKYKVSAWQGVIE